MTALPDLAFYQKLAEAAGNAIMPHFRTQLSVENKLDKDFDPVTAADKNAEREIQDVLAAAYPSHGILGEEFGTSEGDGVHEWVIDPIDGTRAFISGLPVWGVLCGLKVNGIAVSGMMYQPFTDELFCADGGGTCLLQGQGLPSALSTRGTSDLSKATLFTTSPHLYGDAETAYRSVEQQVRLFRYGCDCYAFAMLAAGYADIVIEPGLQPYDIVGLIPVIEQAGGVVTTWDGQRAESGGNIVASANPTLHEKVLEALN